MLVAVTDPTPQPSSETHTDRQPLVEPTRLPAPAPANPADRLRASDEDRDRVAAVIHGALGEGRLTIAEVDDRLAQVYRAKTLGELKPITQDLPGHSLVHPEPASLDRPDDGRAQHPPATVVGGPVSGSAIAVFGGVQRKGVWTVPENLALTTVFGGADLDMTEAAFAARHITVKVFALFGGAQITVPPGVEVINDVTAIFGGVDNKATQATPAGAPTIRVKGFAMFGGLDIRPAKYPTDGRQR